MADLFDDGLAEATVVQLPWHQAPIAPQPVVTIDTPNVPAPPAASLPQPPPVDLGRTLLLPPAHVSSTAAQAPMAPWPALSDALGSAHAYLPALPPHAPYAPHAPIPARLPRVEIIPAKPPWAFAAVAVVLVLALMVPAVLVVAYFAVRTGDAPAWPGAAVSAPAP